MRHFQTLAHVLPSRGPAFWNVVQYAKLEQLPYSPELLPKKISLTEVGPRDGLQNIRYPWSVRQKYNLITMLSAAGFHDVEGGAFVSAKAVPQMVGSDEVLQKLLPWTLKTNFHFLVPTPKKAEEAIALGATNLSVFISASEDFSQRNTRNTIEQGIKNAIEICRLAEQSKTRVRGYVSCVFHSTNKEEKIDPYSVIDISERLLNSGCYEVSLGDTLGTSDPFFVSNLIEKIHPDCRRLFALHLHDTNGRAPESFVQALYMGITSFDGSVAGLGGCPYAPGAAGNIDTRKILFLSSALGIETGVDTAKVNGIASWVLHTLKKNQKAYEKAIREGRG